MSSAKMARLFRFLICLQFFFSVCHCSVSLNRVFETNVTNTKHYDKPLTDVLLSVTFVTPSSHKIPFWGFFDGLQKWRIRCLANETGTWQYSYTWSDNSQGGSGSFSCISSSNDGKGILRPYKQNPHWFAYNGVEPVFLKSYYNKAGGAATQSLSWVAPNVYQKIVDKGYNYYQSSEFLTIDSGGGSLDGRPFPDGPNYLGKGLFSNFDSPSTSFQLDVMQMMDDHLAWLNDHDMYTHFFEGFANHEGHASHWASFSKFDKTWYVRYVCSRVAAYANVAGYLMSWETPGEADDVELGELIRQYDPWHHMYTYECQFPHQNQFSNPIYDFAAVESQGTDFDLRSPEAHHQAVLQGYEGKPVLMSEGNGLWRAFWHASEEQILQNIWAVTTGGATFTWNDIDYGSKSSEMFTYFPKASAAVDLLAEIMTKNLTFHTMVPHDDLISKSKQLTGCLAEVGRQYLVYVNMGGSFDMNLPHGVSLNGVWVDVFSTLGATTVVGKITGQSSPCSFTTPSTGKSYILLLT